MKHIAFVICMLTGVNAYAASIPAIAKDHCGGCHAIEKPLFAPSLVDIATKYRGDPDIASKLTNSINRGGTFGWNSGIRMPPRGLTANDTEIEAMVDFIVGLSAKDLNPK